MRTMIRPLNYILAVFTALLMTSLVRTPSACAQTGSASISGRVTDQSSAVMPDVEVEIKNVDTGVTQATKTNGDGIYSLPALSPGHYLMNVRKQQFRTVSVTGITLNVQDNLSRNFVLQVGSSAESVTVSGNAITINTTDGSVSTVIDQQFVANMPLNGRSFQDLIQLSPGVVTQSPQASAFLGFQGDFSVNGQRTESNMYIVDGVSANSTAGTGNGSTGAGPSGSLGASTILGTTQSLLSIDALQEFRVMSSSYSAEYGTTPGGQFTFVSKSGTSSFHGTAFDYLRNGVFDANDWFNDYYGIKQPALRQNDFGGTFGGPIVLPGHSKEQASTFFFVSYEGLRLTQPTEAQMQYVPSISLRTTAATALQPILNAYPLPTGPEIQVACDNVTYQCPVGVPLGSSVPSGLAPNISAYALPSKIDSTSVRLDHSIGTRVRTFLRAAYTPSSSESRYLSTLTSLTANLQSYTGGVDAIISTAVSNTFRLGYSISVDKEINQIDNFGGAMPVDLGQAMGGSGPTSLDLTELIFSGVGFSNLTASKTANYSRQWNVTDAMNWTFGRQSVTAGVNYRRITSPYVTSTPGVYGLFFNPASVLQNMASDVVYEIQGSSAPRYNQFALFVQDEWRLTNSLNLSAGLRWEVDPAPHSVNAFKPYPLLGNINNPSTLTLGTPGSPLYGTSWGDFAPRIGIAWKAHGNPGAETVFRAGFGVFYDTGLSAASAVFSNTPGLIDQVVVQSAPLPVTSAQLNSLSFNVSPPYSTVVASIAPDFKMPYTLQWNAALQQAVGRKQSLTISYVAASGQRLVEELGVNNVNPLFPGGLIVYKNGPPSNYQSLQINYQTHMNHGFQGIASYTWSHSIDSGSVDGDYGVERGNSNFDLRHNLNAALTWDPHLSLSNKFVGLLLNGWGADGRFFARTAFPVTLNGNSFVNPVTGAVDYLGLNLVPGQPIYIHSASLPGGRGLNPMAFASAPNNEFGDAPRNFARGFGEVQVNMAVRREFPLHENLKLQFRAEAFNILNHPNFGYIDPNLGDATFGQATSSLASSLQTVSSLYQQGGARSMQFALKLIF